jgi:hypothetical protein
MPIKQRITPFLWFNGQAEEAANFYVSIFPNSKVSAISRYGEAGPGPKGSVMTVAFELDGLSFTRQWRSLFVYGGDLAGGSLRDPGRGRSLLGQAFGRRARCNAAGSGQVWAVLAIVPNALIEQLQDKDPAKSQRVMAAMMQMKKIDIAGLKAAYAAA